MASPELVLGRHASGIGQPVPRLEDVRFITGAGRYTDDITLPGQCHMHLVRSPHAAARILSIDCAAAKSAPGVLAVFTGRDADAQGFGYFTAKMRKERRAGGMNFEAPYRVLASERVRFAGDPVAAIFAETPAQARDAAETVMVDYEILPAISTIPQALAEGAPSVWDEEPSNEIFVTEIGDKAKVEAGFAKAAHIAKADLLITRVAHAPIEPRNALGVYDAAEQRFTLYGGMQAPHVTRGELAGRIFKLPENNFRIVAPDVGGSFGLKGFAHPEFGLVLWAAKHLGRPVKWQCDRGEGFLTDHHARDNLAHAELALDETGKFLGLRVNNVVNLGAYLATTGLQCAINNIGGLAGVYANTAIHLNVSGVFTNTTPVCAMRGAGRPEASYIIERLIDIAAMEMNIDAAELRRRNLIPADAFPWNTGFVFTYDCGDFQTNQQAAERMSRWRDFETRRKEAQARGKLRGLGMAHVIEVAAGVRDEMAELRFDPSGGVTIVVGTHSHGQSHETTFRQVVASMLGIEPKDMRMIYGDTDAVAFGRGTGASRSMTAGGTALVRASEKIIQRGKAIAAHLLNAALDDMEFADGLFSVKGTNRKIDLKGVAAAAHDWRQLPPGMEAGFAERAISITDGTNFPNACHICEIEIDPETGDTEIIGYWISEDVGRIVNPLVVKGQIQGGVAQGIGQALSETIIYDKDSAQNLTGSFMDYAMPRASGLPSFKMESHEVLTKTNPLGVKGAGEAGVVGGLAATMNAVCDAMRPLGIKHIDMPATPSRIWTAFHAAKPPS